jgi:hydroxypyruvate isomerase
MIDYAANLSMLFTELPFLDRFAAASRAGFIAVELASPYEHPKEAIAEALRRHRLKLVLHDLPSGRSEHGERSIACDPDRIGEFRAGIDLAIDNAAASGCRALNCLAGIAPSGIPERVLRETLIANLNFAAAKLMRAGMRLLIEPINTRDAPGFYPSSSAQALAIMDEVDARNLSLNYDVYHMHRMGERVASVMESHLPRIAHFRIADVPGRHEPGTGEIDYAALLPFLDAIGYRGWVGCAYRPRDATEAGLGWRQRYDGTRKAA